MRKVILYGAMSLDGYLADREGGVDWICGDGSGEEDMPWYEEFYQGIDTILMGRRTYEQILNELSPGLWLYGDKKTYVFSHDLKEETKEIVFTDKNPVEFVKWLKNRKGTDIWLCGGAELYGSFIGADLVDEYHLTLIPTVLGGGISLFSGFSGNEGEKKLSLVSYRQENGMVDLVYRKR